MIEAIQQAIVVAVDDWREKLNNENYQAWDQLTEDDIDRLKRTLQKVVQSNV
jgi:hypothetical protein